MNYRLVWQIDVEADTPREAAEKALAIQRNPNSIATAFDVFEKPGHKTQVDLGDDE